jgi:hypothetical protein
MTHPDIIDLISNAILDTIDIDWTTDDAARAVYKALLSEGLLAGQSPHTTTSHPDTNNQYSSNSF